eukprot:scaffold2206_cov157-Isochrysis_galbana.AAC.2
MGCAEVALRHSVWCVVLSWYHSTRRLVSRCFPVSPACWVLRVRATLCGCAAGGGVGPRAPAGNMCRDVGVSESRALSEPHHALFY